MAGFRSTLPNHFNLKGTTMFKGKKSYDTELKKHDVKLDRQKPDTAVRELDVEAISDPKLPRRVTGRE